MKDFKMRADNLRVYKQEYIALNMGNRDPFFKINIEGFNQLIELNDKLAKGGRV